MTGAATTAMVAVGDQLGLYRALADGGPATQDELAARVQPSHHRQHSGLSRATDPVTLPGPRSAEIVRNEVGRMQPDKAVVDVQIQIDPSEHARHGYTERRHGSAQDGDHDNERIVPVRRAGHEFGPEFAPGQGSLIGTRSAANIDA